MNPLARIAAAFALMTAVVALAVAADRRETRAVSGFSGIALAAPIRVEIVQGDRESLVLEGDEAALAELETVVERGVLTIRTRPRSDARGMSKVRAYVGARTIESLQVAGSGDIAVGPLRAERLKVAVSGSGDVRIGALDASSLAVSVSGSGDVSVAGKAGFLSTSIAGSGDLAAAKLEAREAKVSIAGSGDAVLWATQSLGVNIVGSGDVRYYGDPGIKRAIVGAGTLRRMGAAPS